jgi:hypothetical protein
MLDRNGLTERLIQFYEQYGAGSTAGDIPPWNPSRRSRKPFAARGATLVAVLVAFMAIIAIAVWRIPGVERANFAREHGTGVMPSAAAPSRAGVDPSNCRLPVVVMLEGRPPQPQLKTEAGFVDTRSGQYAKDGSASVAGLPGGGFPGTSLKPSQPSAPVQYSDALRRWIPVWGSSLAPDGRSYIWVRLLPEGSNSTNFEKAELHRYDVASATDRTLWTYAGSIYVSRWDASGILVNTVPPQGGGRLYWLVDPQTGTTEQKDGRADPSDLTKLPGEGQDGPFGYGVLGRYAPGPTVFRIGGRNPGDPEWVFFEKAPGQRVTIYRGKQGDTTGFDPFETTGDATGIWFGDYNGHTLWHWQQDTGLRKITLTGVPSSANSDVYVNPAGPCL